MARTCVPDGTSAEALQEQLLWDATDPCRYLQYRELRCRQKVDEGVKLMMAQKEGTSNLQNAQQESLTVGQWKQRRLEKCYPFHYDWLQCKWEALKHEERLDYIRR